MGNGRRESTRKYTTPRPASRCVRIAGVRRRVALRVLATTKPRRASRESDEEATRARQERDTTKRRRSDPNTTKEDRARRGVRTRGLHHGARRMQRAEIRTRRWRAEREGRRSTRALVKRSGGKRSDDRSATPPRGKTVHPAHGTTCSTGAVRTTEDRGTSRAAAACRRRCARSLAPCGTTADMEAQLASRSSQLAQLAPRAIRIGGAPSSRLAAELDEAALHRGGRSSGHSSGTSHMTYRRRHTAPSVIKASVRRCGSAAAATAAAPRAQLATPPPLPATLRASGRRGGVARTDEAAGSCAARRQPGGRWQRPHLAVKYGPVPSVVGHRPRVASSLCAHSAPCDSRPRGSRRR